MLESFLSDLTRKPTLETPLEVLAFRLVLATVLGAAVAVVYRYTMRRSSKCDPSFIATLVLLCTLIAMVAQVVGDNVARAFSLVGALSIVRFRTVVEDTRDTAFVIFTVVVGMAVGAGAWHLALIGLAVVAAAAAVLRWVPRDPALSAKSWTLQIRIAAALGEQAPWEMVFAKHLHAFELDSTATTRQGASVDWNFFVQLRSKPIELMNELNRLEGIQNVELKSR